MQHSVKTIGEMYQALSESRKDEKEFVKEDFFKFASENKEKYHIIDTECDLLVSTWYSDNLIKDYQKTMKDRK